MSPRSGALVAAVVVAGLAAWWFTRGDEPQAIAPTSTSPAPAPRQRNVALIDLPEPVASAHGPVATPEGSDWITFHFVDRAGPVSGATLFVDEIATPVDEASAARLMLTHGPHTIRASAPGHTSETLSFAVTHAADIAVRLGLANANPVAAKPLQGVVTDFGGAPVKGASITATGPKNDVVSGQSADDGRFTLAVAEWPATVKVSAAGFTESSRVIESADHPAEFVLNRAIRLTVNVRDANGPVRGAQLAVFQPPLVIDHPDAPGDPWSTTRIHSGPLRIEASAEVGGQLQYGSVDTLIATDSTLEVVLHATEGITGIVVDSRGAPIPGVNVYAWGPRAAQPGLSDEQRRSGQVPVLGPDSDHVLTGPDGRFSLRPSGWRSPSDSYLVQVGTAGRRERQALHVTLGASPLRIELVDLGR